MQIEDTVTVCTETSCIYHTIYTRSLVLSTMYVIANRWKLMSYTGCVNLDPHNEITKRDNLERGNIGKA